MRFFKPSPKRIRQFHIGLYGMCPFGCHDSLGALYRTHGDCRVVEVVSKTPMQVGDILVVRLYHLDPQTVLEAKALLIPIVPKGVSLRFMDVNTVLLHLHDHVKGEKDAEGIKEQGTDVAGPAH